jgi:predicted nucleic-acid-binding Zn-ribbon protein
MVRAVPKTEIIHGGKKYTVFSKVTSLVPRTENGEEADDIIFGRENGGVVNVAVLSAKELDTEALELRVKWLLDTKPRCVKCGAAYNGKNLMRVLAIRNGTYYLGVVCEKCDPRIAWVHSIVTGRS